MSRQISETVLLATYSPAPADAHGNVVDDWAAGSPVGIYAFDPGSSSEPLRAGQDRVITKPTIYMPTAVIFGHRDRVTVRGLPYEVDGETAKWLHPDGSQEGCVVELKRVTG